MAITGSNTISASSVYVEFGFEDNFGAGSTSLPLLFGKDQKATGSLIEQLRAPSPNVICSQS